MGMCAWGGASPKGGVSLGSPRVALVARGQMHVSQRFPKGKKPQEAPGSFTPTSAPTEGHPEPEPVHGCHGTKQQETQHRVY